MMNQYEIDYKQGYDRANDEWLDKVKQAREKISKLHITNIAEGFGDYVGYIDSDMVFKILDKLIESEV